MQELIIFKKSYNFSKWLFNHTNKFPKSHRFSVAVRMENEMLEFLRQITIANHRQKKLPLLHAADEELIVLRINLRLSHDLKFINTSSAVKGKGYKPYVLQFMQDFEHNILALQDSWDELIPSLRAMESVWYRRKKLC